LNDNRCVEALAVIVVVVILLKGKKERKQKGVYVMCAVAKTAPVNQVLPGLNKRLRALMKQTGIKTFDFRVCIRATRSD
jgi:hypothetical protein